MSVHTSAIGDPVAHPEGPEYGIYLPVHRSQKSKFIQCQLSKTYYLHTVSLKIAAIVRRFVEQLFFLAYSDVTGVYRIRLVKKKIL